jgi:hypothetical protein
MSTAFLLFSGTILDQVNKNMRPAKSDIFPSLQLRYF